MWALPLILGRKGCGVNEDYCFFPDFTDPNPEYHFSGVKIGLMDDEVLITDEELSRFVRQACDKYVLLHPEHKQQLAEIVGKEGGRISDGTLRGILDNRLGSNLFADTWPTRPAVRCKSRSGTELGLMPIL